MTLEKFENTAKEKFHKAADAFRAHGVQGATAGAAATMAALAEANVALGFSPVAAAVDLAAAAALTVVYAKRKPTEAQAKAAAPR